jgi:hypothetical protein
MRTCQADNVASHPIAKTQHGQPDRPSLMGATPPAVRVNCRKGLQQPDVMLAWFKRHQDPFSSPMYAEDARRVKQMRRLVGARLLLCRLPELVDPMLLVTSELVTNALRHGEGPGVSLLLSSYEQRAHLRVRDGSHGSPRLLAPSVLAESGRGLFLVEATARELGGSWGISSDHTQTWCELPRPCTSLGAPGSLDADCAGAETASDSTSSVVSFTVRGHQFPSAGGLW